MVEKTNSVTPPTLHSGESSVISEEDLDFVNSFFGNIAASVQKPQEQPKEVKLPQYEIPQYEIPQYELPQQIQQQVQQQTEKEKASNPQNIQTIPLPAPPPQNKTTQLTKNQKKRQRKRKANQRKPPTHIPKDTADLDFDALLDLHEKHSAAATPPHQQQPQNLKNDNKRSASPQAVDLPQNSRNDKKRSANQQEVVERPQKKIKADEAPIIHPQNLKNDKKRSANHQEVVERPQKKIKANEAPIIHHLKDLQAISAMLGNEKKINLPKKDWQPPKNFVPRVNCVHFSRGYCAKGDTCTFKHDPESVIQPEKPNFVKTDVVCQFFKTGSCAKFDCPFSHNLKLEPCRFFHMDGQCKNNNCPYSHEELTSDSLERLRKLTGPCRFYFFKGYCDSGMTCKFSHDEGLSEEERKKVESEILPCRYYHLFNSCRNGSDCFYLHDEATAAQIQSLKNVQNRNKSIVM